MIEIAGISEAACAVKGLIIMFTVLISASGKEKNDYDSLLMFMWLGRLNLNRGGSEDRVT